MVGGPGNLAAEIRRTEPYADLYHIDVADGHFVPSLLFFPDLVATLRPLTRKPFHVHLMATNPTDLIDDFADAGADIITIHYENQDRDAVLSRIRQRGLCAGLALQLETPIERAADYCGQVDVFVLLGTRLGIKGVGLDSQACPRIAALRRLLRREGCEGQDQDSGRRRHSRADRATARPGRGGHRHARFAGPQEPGSGRDDAVAARTGRTHDVLGEAKRPC